MHRQLVLSGIVAAVAAFALGGAVLAAGGGFGGPGTFTFSDRFATAEMTDSTGAFMFINVDYGMQTFKVRGVNGPPVVVGPQTVLNYQVMSADGTTTAIGCFVIPDSSFQVASGLASATLTVDPSIETPCPGFLVPAGAGGRPGLAVVPDAGGGGGGGGTPITAHLVWTSDGAVTVSTNTSNSRCQGTVANSNGTSSSTITTLSGSVSSLSDVVTQFASLQTFSSRETITGFFSNACTGA